MKRAPTRRELEVLRWIAAGAELYEAGQTQYRVAGLAAFGTAFGSGVLISRKLVEKLRAAGWLGFTPRHAFLTMSGRDVAELSASVRAFAEAPR